jgi:YHS domain-containing protein
MKQLMKASLRFALALAILNSVMVFSVQAQKNYNLSDDQLAIKGFDPVAYFTDKEAKEGDKKFTYSHNGVNYRFVNAQHLEAFKATPEKYQPQYGGWCAYAMGATGEKVDIDPETFKLKDGKLYLFYNRFFNNTKKTWDKDEANLKQKADANWKKISP